ncbi:MAG: PilZ domain-containing protein [Chromatiales bacterium]|jgi:hypothetical protein|nr:PilZ domain-containing protein [Chromatiales bacterium]MDX9768133.1 PilZ domain-containing protein [Ectothiorhodospiraceae bacterium]
MDTLKQLLKAADERRRHVRVPVEIHVECYCDGQHARVLRTLDLSESGVFLVVDPITMPGIGGEVELQVVGTLGGGETPPRVRARVVRVTDEGVGLEFLP